MKNLLIAILTTIPILVALAVDHPLSIAILVFFVPLSLYYIGLVISARARTKEEEEKREEITFTGY